MQQQQNSDRVKKGAKHVLSVVTDTILGKIVTVAVAAAVAGVGGALAVQKNQKAAGRTSRPAVSENGRYGSSDQINGAAGTSDSSRSRQESSSDYAGSDSSESESVSSRSENSSREETQSDSDRGNGSSSSDTSSSSSSDAASSESASQPADSQ